MTHQSLWRRLFGRRTKRQSFYNSPLMREAALSDKVSQSIVSKPNAATPAAGETRKTQ